MIHDTITGDLEQTNAHRHKKSYFNSRRQPTISFVFDTGFDTDALALKIAELYGFKITFAISNTAYIAANIDFYKKAYTTGHGIYVHGRYDVSTGTSFTYQEVDDSMAEIKAFFFSHGIIVSGYVPLASSIDASFLPLVKKHFGYAFTGETYNDNFSEDPTTLRRVGMEAAVNAGTIDGVKTSIDEVITYTLLRTYYSHQMPSAYLNGGVTKLSVQDYKNILAYAREKVDAGELQVLETDEAMHSYYRSPII
jgi:hypothetical protein